MIRYKIRAAAFRIPLMRLSKDMKEKFSFGAREYLQGWRKPIYIPYVADEGINVPWVAHNFWILVKEEDGQATEVEAAHAFASQLQKTDTGDTVARALPVGKINDYLMIHFLQKPASDEVGQWLSADEEDQIDLYGTEPEHTDVLKRWQRLKIARIALNSYKVPYSAFGLGWTLGLGRPTLNSNSGYRTMGMIMELPIHEFKHWQPGIENTMIPLEELEDLIQILKQQEVEKQAK